jgi:GAF domain-containing protein
VTDEAAIRALLAAVARRLDAAGRIATERPEDLLTAIAGSVVTALDAQAASIAVHDPATDRLVFRAAAGPAAGAVVGLSIEASAGIAGYAFTSGQPLAVADAPADPRFDRSVADATGYVPSSLLAVPLIDDAGTVGVLEALDRRGGSFTLRDLDIAGAIAATATIAVRSAAVRGDATAVLRASLASLMGDEDGADRDEDGAERDDATIDALVSAATRDLAGEDGTIWALADRIARLRDADPASVELVTDWLDALLRRSPARPAGRR